MSSESVWFEEIDTALVKYIRTIFPNTRVVIRRPDMDFNEELYPCISIYAKGYKMNRLRYNHDIKVKTGIVDDNVIMENPAIPFDIDYQIDFWTTSQNEMNNFTLIWLSHIDRHINLDVLDKSGNERNILFRQNSGIIKSDLLSGDRRIFHTVLEYVAWTELDERIADKIPAIQNIDIIGGIR